jgi:hypothetical protein
MQFFALFSIAVRYIWCRFMGWWELQHQYHRHPLDRMLGVSHSQSRFCGEEWTPCLCRVLNSDCPGHSPVTIPTELSRPLVSTFSLFLPFWSIGMISQFLDHLQTVELLRRVISSPQGLYLNTVQHKHRKTHTHIKIHALNGIRTHDPGFRASLRPLGYRDRLWVLNKR